MEKEILTFNDLPQVVAQLRDEVMGMRAMLTRQQVESWLGENEIWSDSNDYIYEQYLEPGIYIVGEHVPEADYDIEIIAGTYGELDIYEYNGSELSLKDF